LLRRRRIRPAIGCDLFAGRCEDRPTDCNRETVLAGTLESFVGRAGTPDRESISHSHEVLVVFGVRVTAVSNAHTC